MGEAFNVSGRFINNEVPCLTVKKQKHETVGRPCCWTLSEDSIHFRVFTKAESEGSEQSSAKSVIVQTVTDSR